MESSVREKIEQRAYELFLSRGGLHGYHKVDWDRAEKEVMDMLEDNDRKAVPPAPSVEPPAKTTEAVAKTEVKNEQQELDIAAEKTAKPKKTRSANGTVAKKRVVKKKMA